MAHKDAYPLAYSPGAISKPPSMRSDKMSLRSDSDLVRTPELSVSDKVSGSDMHPTGSASSGAAGKKKWLLLLIFSVSQFLDLCSRASAVVFIDKISRDLDIDYETSTWILNSYGVTFGSFLLLWGRVSDLYSAKMVFSLGFLFCGAFSLIISFMTNQYAFYIIRAFYGIAAAATIPSAFQLILAVFEPKEVQIALSLFGLSGAIANAMGLLIGGAFGEITSSGQGADWRWFFRFVCFVSVPFALVSWLVIPSIPSKLHANRIAKWKLLDILGSFLILAALMLFNVGLTMGASRGWVNARFLVPTILCVPLVIAFFVWEYRLGEVKALIPVSLWRINNVALMSWVACGLFPYMACIQLPLVERYQIINGESSIKASLRMLPQGLAMCVVVILASGILKKIVNMRWAIGFGLVIAAAMYVPLIYGDGSTTTSGYWSYYAPAFIVGSAAFAIAYLGVNITMMTAASASMAGVVGALFQVCLQTGVTTGISIQSGLLTVNPGSIGNWKNVQTSWWFQFGWCLLMGISVLAFYQPRVIASQTEEQTGQVMTLEERRQEV